MYNPSNVLEISSASIFRVKYETKGGGSWFLQNVVTCLQNHTVKQILAKERLMIAIYARNML
jgi:hypothetical protein